MSTARHAYGPTEVPVAEERPRIAAAAIPFLSIALTVVAVWFVLLPAIREKPPSLQTCEVVLLADGTTTCANGEALANVVSKQP